MMRYTRWPGLALLAGLACDRPDAAPAPALDSAAAASAPDSSLTSRSVPGVLRWAPTLQLMPCGATSSLAITDPQGALQGLPVELRSDTSGVFVLLALDRTEVKQVHFATGEGRDCFLDWRSFDLRAQGNEPGWVIELNRTDMKLQRQGGASFSYTEVHTTIAPDGTRQSASAAGNRVELQLKPTPCLDTMSGAYYGWTAIATIGNEILHGCGMATR